MTMLAPTATTLEDAVMGYVALGSGLKRDTNVLSGNENGPAPNDLYASVLLIRSRSDGMPSDRATQTGSIQSLTEAAVQDRYSVQWYRKGARDAAQRFRLWTASPEAQEYMDRVGLAFVRTSEVRQIDSIISDAWEERAGLELDIGYIQSLRQDVQEVQTVPIEIRSETNTETVEVIHDSES